LADDFTDEEDLELAPSDAGSLFRAEMWATNALLGYWKHLILILLAGLVGILVYNQYLDSIQRYQRKAAAEIFESERELPADLIQLPQLMEQGDEKATPEKLIEIADVLHANATTYTHTARVEAYLKAAELFRLAGASDKQRASLQGAVEGADGVLAYAARAGLANLDLEAGAGDQAVAHFRALTAVPDDQLAQQATLDLGMALEHLDRKAEAATVYTDYLTRWPDASGAETARNRNEGLAGEAG
jgi:TolA-binding protein